MRQAFSGEAASSPRTGGPLPAPPGAHARGGARARRLLMAALAALLAGVQPSFAVAAKEQASGKAAPDPRAWSLVKGYDTFVLRYAAPRETEPDFAITCQPSAQLLQIALEVQNAKFGSGDGVALSLSTGKRRLELAATAFVGSVKGDLVVEAAVALEPRPLDLFKAGDTLTVKMPGATQTYPLAGLRTRMADFERACLGGR